MLPHLEEFLLLALPWSCPCSTLKLQFHNNSDFVVNQIRFTGFLLQKFKGFLKIFKYAHKKSKNPPLKRKNPEYYTKMNSLIINKESFWIRLPMGPEDSFTNMKKLSTKKYCNFNSNSITENWYDPTRIEGSERIRITEIGYSRRRLTFDYKRFPALRRP